MKAKRYKIGNGSLPVPFCCKLHFTVIGGPYRQCPPNMMGVKMAQEIDLPCAVSIPTRDYCVPTLVDMNRGLIEAVGLVLKREPLYVGCAGGIGRTGLFLAILAKAFGVKDPVAYVREYYHPHAVETVEQRYYVGSFPITPQVRILIKNARKKYWWRFWMSGLTKLPVDISID